MAVVHSSRYVAERLRAALGLHSGGWGELAVAPIKGLSVNFFFIRKHFFVSHTHPRSSFLRTGYQWRGLECGTASFVAVYCRLQLWERTTVIEDAYKRALHSVAPAPAWASTGPCARPTGASAPMEAAIAALRGAEYRAGYLDGVNNYELNALSAAIAFINDPDGQKKYGRRYVFEFGSLVENVCARVDTKGWLHSVANGVIGLNPRTRGGPTIEFRAMYHLAILLTCLRKAALVFVDDSDETVGHIHEFAGGFCEGTLREWNAKCLLAWCHQTRLPAPTRSTNATLSTYRANSNGTLTDSVDALADSVTNAFSNAGSTIGVITSTMAGVVTSKHEEYLKPFLAAGVEALSNAKAGVANGASSLYESGSEMVGDATTGAANGASYI